MEAFKTLLSDTGEWRASLDGLSFQRISEEEATRLELPFTDKVLKGESVRRGVFVFVRRGVSLEALRRKLFEHHNI